MNDAGTVAIISPLLKRDYNARLSLRSSHSCDKRDIPGAQTCGDRQVDLVKKGRVQTRKGRQQTHAID